MFDTPEKLYLVVVSDYPNAWWRFIVKTKIDQIDAERKAMSGVRKMHGWGSNKILLANGYRIHFNDGEDIGELPYE